MITILDYQMGNLKSVAKAIESLDYSWELVTDPESILDAQKLIVPGVGGFPDCMKVLHQRGLDGALLEYIESGRPYLGICLGMQILMEVGEEGGKHEGLGFFKGRVKRFDPKLNLKIPHMGWNRLQVNPDSQVLEGLGQDPYVYFVHSYYVEPEDKSIIASQTDYGVNFASALEKDNVYAVQFHPEKSQKVGLKILDNFCKL
ncbi:MAG: imidazole glycerol phosphate synthase subunit HisH [Deltaproteobacteria bacterium]|nr:imidazole glycerol phosphate synthase subunit HisH [Deltaproteobacteria bacterium]